MIWFNLIDRQTDGLQLFDICFCGIIFDIHKRSSANIYISIKIELRNQIVFIDIEIPEIFLSILKQFYKSFSHCPRLSFPPHWTFKNPYVSIAVIIFPICVSNDIFVTHFPHLQTDLFHSATFLNYFIVFFDVFMAKK